ncbi:MAG: ferritin family protein [Planctomycetota bacterium]|nr:ferritin family protein [Planctomycetota bacterium]
MVLNKDLCGILAVGEQKERAARDFYLEAARRTTHPIGKQMFERLSKEETAHAQLLQGWANNGLCPVDVKFPPVDKDWLARAKAKIREAVKPDTSDLEALQIGQEQERKSIAFYLDCAGKSPDQASKDLFLRLKSEEDKHLALLSDLYDYLVNPELWSVRDERANFDS